MGSRHQSPSMKIGDAGLPADLAREADHRIANHLAMLAGYVLLEATRLRDGPEGYSRDEVKLILERLRAQVLLTADLHRALALRPGCTVDLAEHLSGVAGGIALACCGRAVLHREMEEGCTVAPDAALASAQIVSEAMLNAIKHAKPSGDWVRLVVRCWRDGPDAICVEVADDGRGFKGSEANSRGLGMRLIRGLARRANGHAQFLSGPDGFRVRVRLDDQPALERCVS